MRCQSKKYQASIVDNIKNSVENVLIIIALY
jgi:hypothetical protein